MKKKPYKKPRTAKEANCSHSRKHRSLEKRKKDNVNHNQNRYMKRKLRKIYSSIPRIDMVNYVE